MRMQSKRGGNRKFLSPQLFDLAFREVWLYQSVEQKASEGVWKPPQRLRVGTFWNPCLISHPRKVGLWTSRNLYTTMEIRVNLFFEIRLKLLNVSCYLLISWRVYLCIIPIPYLGSRSSISRCTLAWRGDQKVLICVWNIDSIQTRRISMLQLRLSKKWLRNLVPVPDEVFLRRPFFWP